MGHPSERGAGRLAVRAVCLERGIEYDALASDNSFADLVN